VELSFWAKTSGTWINAASVLLGTGLGLMLHGRLSLKLRQTVVQGVGLTTLFIGFLMAKSLTDESLGQGGVVLGLLAIALGGALGEALGIEAGLEAVGERVKAAVRGGGRFTEGFLTASLLFCVGPMTVIGALNNGLLGDPSLLLVKATLDGISSIALAATLGVGVGFSVFVLLIYQIGLSLLAGALGGVLPDPAHDPRVLLATGVGGLMVIGIGLNLVEATRVRVGSFLPALFLAPLFVWLWYLVS